MAKEVQMLIKMEPELRDQFMVVAANRDSQAAQIIRDLMRLYIEASKTPNALTVETIRKSGEGKDIFYASGPENWTISYDFR